VLAVLFAAGGSVNRPYLWAQSAGEALLKNNLSRSGSCVLQKNDHSLGQSSAPFFDALLNLVANNARPGKPFGVRTAQREGSAELRAEQVRLSNASAIGLRGPL
jgi:hypothetical protein